MNVEISGPPGIGKTCICTGIALSAISSTASSLGEGDGGTEVLIVGESDAVRCVPGTCFEADTEQIPKGLSRLRD